MESYNFRYGKMFTSRKVYELKEVKTPFGLSTFNTLLLNLTKEHVKIIKEDFQEEEFKIKTNNYGSSIHAKFHKKCDPRPIANARLVDLRFKVSIFENFDKERKASIEIQTITKLL